jgi:Kef-type K+ transport system membrane component KefB
MDFNLILLLPVFFAFSGLNTQLTGLNDVQLLLPLAAALVAACVGKYLGCALTARWHGIPWRQSWAIGGLMNARGLMILVFINVGLAHDLVSPELFAMLVIVAVVTTATAMPLYQLHIPPHMESALHHETRPGQPAVSNGDPGALDGGGDAGDGGGAGRSRTPEGVT